ncbi:DUF1810 domain-containing protein [Piscinibacter koreensis]|uniref:DUF1810 domain-containing protein n=1 Tax=Piscinibacter koreensis TaxID=2742824 RepID=A0A7Y6NML9_9BURK|nr:DUF1810 domain-containing protein [Schlegelella koreensis]NUZ05864.1 DUF1810 domain-containing protein [Schlegelella koreensis]
MTPDDPHDLQRFVVAQAPVHARALAELRAGRKTTHWMWFVFPQLTSLGRSATARHYGIASAAEARAYLDHALLGRRLRECVDALLALPGGSAHEIFGSPDDLKLRSSLTLFAFVAPDEQRFAAALDRFFDGAPDAATLALLREQRGRPRT